MQLRIIKKICGVFAISKNCLSIVSGAQPQKIEISESIEQMKIIELGINILAVNTKLNYPSVNTPEEAILVERILDMDPRQKQILEMIN
jgi:CMP-2-keto-3-deoxyoctulosonic acid synthetase